MSKHHKNTIKKADLTAKLTFFDWGWADNVIFSLKAMITEKHKGFLMIEKIKMFFNINNKDIINNEEQHIKREINDIKEMQKEKSKIKWTRDEQGNIISPFRTKKLT